MDKYKNMAPRDKFRYQPRRGNKAHCCFSRVGTVKVSYSSKDDAAASGLVPYPCQINEGKWHGKKKR